MTRDIFKDYLLSTVRMHLKFTRIDLNKKDQIGLVIIDNFSGHKLGGDELAEIERRLEARIFYLLAYFVQ